MFVALENRQIAISSAEFPAIFKYSKLALDVKVVAIMIGGVRSMRYELQTVFRQTSVRGPSVGPVTQTVAGYADVTSSLDSTRTWGKRSDD